MHDGRARGRGGQAGAAEGRRGEMWGEVRNPGMSLGSGSPCAAEAGGGAEDGGALWRRVAAWSSAAVAEAEGVEEEGEGDAEKEVQERRMRQKRRMRKDGKRRKRKRCLWAAKLEVRGEGEKEGEDEAEKGDAGRGLGGVGQGVGETSEGQVIFEQPMAWTGLRVQ